VGHPLKTKKMFRSALKGREEERKIHKEEWKKKSCFLTRVNGGGKDKKKGRTRESSREK